MSESGLRGLKDLQDDVVRQCWWDRQNQDCWDSQDDVVRGSVLRVDGQ